MYCIYKGEGNISFTWTREVILRQPKRTLNQKARGGKSVLQCRVGTNNINKRPRKYYIKFNRRGKTEAICYRLVHCITWNQIPMPRLSNHRIPTVEHMFQLWELPPITDQWIMFRLEVKKQTPHTVCNALIKPTSAHQLNQSWTMNKANIELNHPRHNIESKSDYNRSFLAPTNEIRRRAELRRNFLL